jgi:predicted N-acetyltransferase YhbS
MKKKMVSWASYHPRTGSARFGPIAVLEEMRGNGIGSCLMLECVLRIIDTGADRVVAGWANTPFYLANDWKICCQYSVLEKSIA